MHLDCDVLEPGIVRIEYQVTGGLSLEDLRACATMLAQRKVIGIEIAEFESEWLDGRPASPDGSSTQSRRCSTDRGGSVRNRACAAQEMARGFTFAAGRLDWPEDAIPHPRTAGAGLWISEPVSSL